MGLYADLQEKIGNAFDTTLADATRTVQFVTYASVYNDDTMENVLTPTSTNVRAVKLTGVEGEILDDPALEDSASYLVMDSERNSVVFEVGMKVTDGSDDYKILGVESDPAGASWQLHCRKWS